ncbi:hypothetical protein Golomagni_03953 [Golovinomyces magnicellulatus]|nr:hypothetical protein Golomagni_03953 [Golovinomyces magnicellulatus]
MAKETLDSDRINYMIWRWRLIKNRARKTSPLIVFLLLHRYLIELGMLSSQLSLIFRPFSPKFYSKLVIDYCETAIRLQKEWNMEDPRRLAFAPYVPSHALVSILNRGLIYNMYERGFAMQEQQDLSTSANGAQKAATVGFFGPVLPPSPKAEDFSVSRKHIIDRDPVPQLLDQVAKKPRLSNGCNYSQAPKQSSCEPVSKFSDTRHEHNVDSDVQINGNNDEQAYPSPKQMPTPQNTTSSSGHEKGIQVEKVNDLTTETIFLELTDHPENQGTVLTHCAFHPRDPSVLVAAGSDALARIWSLKSLPSPVESETQSPGVPICAPHRNLHDYNAPVTTQATAMSWDPLGNCLAIASQPSDTGLARLDFWNEDASLLFTNFGIDPPILNVEWNPSGTACLVISPRDDTADVSITVIYPALETVVRQTISSHNLIEQLLDVAWMSDDEFILCGGNLLQTFLCSAKTCNLTSGRKYEVPDGVSLSEVAYDPHSQLLATASDTGMIYIWGKDKFSRAFTAHQGLITHISWQPLPKTRDSSTISERMLASAGEDGVISIWNILSPKIKSLSSISMCSGISAMSFSPDGIYLAGATYENIFIWRAESLHIPCATWHRQYDAGWQTPLSTESNSKNEEICSLSWDSESGKLAYGINNRLAVINFQP